ncbi:methionine import ATP-binding protein MetN [Clostridium acetireducens DSM 10703]|uniref:Methionine import ATP-binding protein MetN n=1 Tax=Clostridium acetireducens DSM 10703 TaxID=1121290 RepID=A0A1E8EWY6_9CLOT|nr:methionine ABC transporter ATP-binding protein [Clostridium acetireducens]OFI05299.1 methionine import ATP-binding protein MetN [Clostridium acetireducens DSM 10703]
MIEVKNVSKNFLGYTALKNVSMNIKKGEIFGIVGHSGAGKSTLLRCFNGLEDYDVGSIRIMDNEVKELKGQSIREFRKNLGMIFQNFNLLSRKNVFDNIAFPLETWGFSKDKISLRVKELLKLVELEDKVDSKPKALSGGQKQRVAIARALALQPEILLCDEATSALDPNTTKSILQLLKEINEKLNITIVIVTHQMEVVKEICDRVAILEKGEVKSIGKVEKLFLKPDKNLKRLLGEEEVLPDEGVNIKLFFPKDQSMQCIITSMARKLDIDVSIVWGKLERFKDDVLGNLVINTSEENKEKICKFLDERDINWEVISNGN